MIASRLRGTLGRHTLGTESARASFSLDTITKRLATELVFDLCDSTDEFTLRCGVGNAIAFLQVRKLMPMPGQKV